MHFPNRATSPVPESTTDPPNMSARVIVGSEAQLISSLVTPPGSYQEVVHVHIDFSVLKDTPVELVGVLLSRC